MKSSRVRNTGSLVLAAGVAGFSTPLWAHGPNITLTQSGGQIITHAIDIDEGTDGYTPDAVARSFQIIPMAYQSSSSYPNDNGWYGQLEATQPSDGQDTTFLGPGLAFGQGGFGSTNVFRVTFTDIAKVWLPDGSAAGGSFIGTGGEIIQGIRGNFNAVTGFTNTLTSNSVQVGSGITTGAVGTTTNNHSQIRWRLLGSTDSPVPSVSNVIDDGLYLASLQVSAFTDVNAASPYETSLPYYLLFEKGSISSTDIANAQAYIQSALVPEPASIALLGLSGLLLVRRRYA